MCPGSFWIKGSQLETEALLVVLAEHRKKDDSGARRVLRRAGVRAVPAEGDGDGCGRQSGPSAVKVVRLPTRVSKMNMKSGFLFSISVCMFVHFWNHIVTKRAFPVLFHMASMYSSVVSLVCPSIIFRRTYCQQASGSAISSSSEEHVGCPLRRVFFFFC